MAHLEIFWLNCLVWIISQALPHEKLNGIEFNELEGSPQTKLRVIMSRADKDLMLNDIRFPPGFDHLNSKFGVVDEKYHWPNGKVIYQIDPNFSDTHTKVIIEGMDEIARKTCIKFEEWDGSQNDYVFIQRGEPNSGCWSYVGFVGGMQILNLQIPEYEGAPHCVWNGTVAHELLHSLGVFHEQSRWDRDDYVEIIWSNIQPGLGYNFDKVSIDIADIFNETYDYSSIMHYHAFAFAIDPSRPTIIAKVDGVDVLGGKVLTDHDQRKLNRMYKCKPSPRYD